MRAETKAKRQAQIEAAAYDVLAEKGFQGTSMLAVARRAKASNETLYNWYGDKTGLFAALVRKNAAEVRAMLEHHLSAGDDLFRTLGDVGPALLSVLTGPRAIALNRAAAADASGTLGAVLREEGREAVAPLLSSLVEQHIANGQLRSGNSAEHVTETYISLLIGDLQIRCVAGHMPSPSPSALQARSERALAQFKRLYSA